MLVQELQGQQASSDRATEVASALDIYGRPTTNSEYAVPHIGMEFGVGFVLAQLDGGDMTSPHPGPEILQEDRPEPPLSQRASGVFTPPQALPTLFRVTVDRT